MKRLIERPELKTSKSNSEAEASSQLQSHFHFSLALGPCGGFKLRVNFRELGLVLLVLVLIPAMENADCNCRF